MKRAFLFPGQGAQVVGMGKDICEKYEVARKVYEEAEKASGMPIRKICFEGPQEVLNETKNTQIAILTTSLAMLAVLKSNNIEADIATGLSLGEYGALVYSGRLNFKEAISLVQKRGYYMGTLLPEGEYSMAAVIGLSQEKIEKVCSQIAQTGKFIVPANYNCQAQTAISGETKAIDEAMEKLKQEGAKKVIKLKTSGPFHTSKLEKAQEAYRKELDKVTFQEGKVKVIKNIDGTYYQENDDWKKILAKHIVSPVRFDKAIALMQEEGIEEYVEIGPGKTLTGFIKKENKEAKTFAIHDLETLENYLNEKKGEV